MEEEKKRFCGSITPNEMKTIKMAIAELGIDEKERTANKANSRMLSLMVKILENEMKMARKATGLEFLTESALIDYVEKKCKEVLNAAENGKLL